MVKFTVAEKKFKLLLESSNFITDEKLLSFICCELTSSIDLFLRKYLPNTQI